MKKARVLILGGGFGGLYAALDIFFSKDFVQYLHERAAVVADTSVVPSLGQADPPIQPAFTQPSELTAKP